MLLFVLMVLNLSPAKKAIMLSPLHTPVKVITFPLILDCNNVLFTLRRYIMDVTYGYWKVGFSKSEGDHTIL